MSIDPDDRAAVAAALAALPVHLRATRAADFTWLMQRAERMSRISPEHAAELRAGALVMLEPPQSGTAGRMVRSDDRCDDCGGLVGRDGRAYLNTALEIDSAICADCIAQAQSIHD